MGEETKARGTAEGSATTKKIEKKRSRNGATRSACFRGIPQCCWQTPFFGAVRPPRIRPFLVLPLVLYGSLPSLSLLRLFSHDPHPRATNFFLFPYSFSILQVHSVPLGHLLVRPRYPNISKSKKKKKKINKKKR